MSSQYRYSYPCVVLVLCVAVIMRPTPPVQLAAGGGSHGPIEQLAGAGEGTERADVVEP